VGGALALFAWRAQRIGAGGRFEPVSREALLLTNNVLLMAAAGSVMLGTLYPLALDALGLGKISVGPPYFDAVFVPLMAPALFLMGVGPIARWKRAELPELAARLRWALGVSVATALIVPFAMGRWSWLVGFAVWLAAWIVASAGTSLVDRLRHAAGAGVLARLRAQPRAYYGMLLAHVGVAVFVIGVALVRGYETEKDVRMAPGDITEAGGHVFRFEGVEQVQGPNYVAARATLAVARDGRPVTTLRPERRAYRVQEAPMTEADIDNRLTGDLYVALADPVGNDAWIVRIHVKPFVAWIWGGCVLMALGGLLAATDRRYRVTGRDPRPAPHAAAVRA
jgi:cytochrome c-type biogenesis protein CcmF